MTTKRSFTVGLVAIGLISSIVFFAMARFNKKPAYRDRSRVEKLESRPVMPPDSPRVKDLGVDLGIQRNQYVEPTIQVLAVDDAERPIAGVVIEDADGSKISITNNLGLAAVPQVDTILVASHAETQNFAFLIATLPTRSDGLRQLTMLPIKRIFGAVVDRSGSPVSGCQVLCVRGSASESKPRARRAGSFLPESMSVRTGPDGSFCFAAIPGLKYEVFISDSAYLSSGTSRVVHAVPPVDGITIVADRIYAAAIRVRNASLPSAVVYDTLRVRYDVPSGFKSLDPLDNRSIGGCENLLRQRIYPNGEPKDETLLILMLRDRRSNDSGAARIVVPAGITTAAATERMMDLSFIPASVFLASDSTMVDDVASAPPAAITVKSPIRFDLLTGDGGLGSGRIRAISVDQTGSRFVVPPGSYTVRPEFCSLLAPRWIRRLTVGSGEAALVDLTAEAIKPVGEIGITVSDASGNPTARYSVSFIAENNAEFMYQGDGKQSEFTVESELQWVKIRLLDESGTIRSRKEIHLTADAAKQTINLQFE